MANRICPMCFAKVARCAVLAASDEVDCPKCGRALELSRPSKLLASFAGLVGACAAWRCALRHGAASPFAWVLPVAAAILGFSVAAPLFLALHSDLVVRKEMAPEPLPAAGASGHGTPPGGHN